MDIAATEAYATLRHTLPASLTWLWRKYITHEITTIPIQVTLDKITKIAYLNIHGKSNLIKNDKQVRPVLLSHGDFGHSFNLLHLADIAHEKGHPAYSLYIPGVNDNTRFDLHDSLMEKAISKIESIINENQGKFVGIVGAGHSKGAILLAQRQFVALDPRIKSMCSIAGRLKVPSEKDCPNQTLRTIVRNIHKGIFKNPELPILQIIPKDDWNASYESMAVRPHEHCNTVPGMHLSALYSSETRNHFSGFLNKFA